MRLPVIVALDFHDCDAALACADQLSPDLCRVKVGKELFVRAGPQVVRALIDRGFDVFLDLKFHDIPNTVAGAVHAAADLGVWMADVHALGGAEMMQAADRARRSSNPALILIAVTVLTSHDSDDLAAVRLPDSVQSNVEHLATMANDAGLDGVVCSARDLNHLTPLLPDSFQYVTPGIRPGGAGVGDQKRVMTPAEAIGAGASHLVIGRPITRADDPRQALLTLSAEIADIL